MSYHVDATRLIDTFAETDPRMPLLVFALLSMYLESGPFQFDASVLAERLDGLSLKARFNPEQLASLQPDFERFFESTSDGWVPRQGVLTISKSGAAATDHIGEFPGGAAN